MRARQLLSSVVPTDYRFQMMRVLDGRGKADLEALRSQLSKASPSMSIQRRVALPMGNVSDNIRRMQRGGLITKRGKAVELTPFGRSVFRTTRDVLFGGVAPDRITPAYTKMRRSGRRFSMGPLTTTFAGQNSKQTLATLLDLVDRHEQEKANWLQYAGAISDFKINNRTSLFRLGLVEFETPTTFSIPSTQAYAGRGNAKVFHGARGQVYELTGPAFRSFQELKEQDVARVPSVSKGPYPKRAVEDLRLYLKGRGVETSVADRINTPTQAKVLWWLSKGVHDRLRISKLLKMSSNVVDRAAESLEQNGLIRKRPAGLFRVTLGAPAAAVASGEMQEIFTTDQVVEYLRRLERLIEKNQRSSKRI